MFLVTKGKPWHIYNYDQAMHSPVFVPLLIAAAMCIVCLFAGGSSPQAYFQEWQPATVFNAIQLFFCALFAAAIASTVPPKARTSKASALVWSLVCGACLYAGIDEVFELHENSGPVAQWLAEWLGQPGNHPVIAGIEIPSYAALIELGYALFAAVFAIVLRKELFAQQTAAWMFSLAALFLCGAALVDLQLIQGHGVIAGADTAFCQGFVKAVAYSLKLVGCAALLGGFMEVLTAKRRMISLERMLSDLNQHKSSDTRERVSI